MKSKRFLPVLLLFMLFSSFVLAKEGIYHGQEFDINISYSEAVFPGDAVFIKMKLTSAKGIKIQKDAKTTAKAEIFDKKKKISASDFFTVSTVKKSQQTVEMMAAMPLSTWLDSGNFSIIVTFTPFGMQPMEFYLPLTISAKEFEKEEIALSEKNTKIRTDNSPKKVIQIDRLNTIFTTINNSSIYSFENFILPVESQRRTSGFGDRRIYVYSTGKRTTALHYGIDFGVPEGTEVFACSSGKVVLAENRISTGNSIVIEHLPGLYSIYYHLSEMNVTEGQKVKKGDRIALSGKTGMVTGPHLHWEVRLNGQAVNPDIFTQNFARK
ncbi:MAG: M23 family metallopeptidase [Treponema sp.]|nr:M23 family metallopeptidase [Treponema sp.]